MRLAHLIVLALLLPFAPAWAAAPTALPAGTSLADVVAPLLPAVVSIAVLHEPAA
jgi:hypothetical protein